MPRRKPAPLVQLESETAVDKILQGRRVWCDLIDTARLFGLPPEAFLPALQSGELVATRKPGKRGKEWSNFLLASDTLIAFIAKRGLEPVGTPSVH